MSERLNTEGAILYFDDFAPAGEETNANRFLSNFYVGKTIHLPVTWDSVGCTGHEENVWAPTGEHIFAAFKTRDPEQFLEILHAMTLDETTTPRWDPGRAKSLGRKCDLRSDWEQIKYDVMAMVLRAKFTLDREEGELLLGTGDALLVEGTYWADRVWGVALGKNTGYDPLTAPGRNWLGTLLMARRAELRAERMYGVSAQTLAGNVRFIS